MTQNVNPLLAVLSYQPCLLRISNPQGGNRLGHFFTPDFKSVGTPSGVAFSNPSGRLAGLRFQIRRDAWRGCDFKSVGTPSGVAFSNLSGRLAGLRFQIRRDAWRVAFLNPSGRLAGCVFESVGTPAASGLVLEAVDRGRDSAYTVHEI